MNYTIVEASINDVEVIVDVTLQSLAFQTEQPL